VAEALGRVDVDIPQKLLAKALANETEKRVRIAICDTLGRVGDSESEEALISALSDRSWLVREAALRALARVGTMKCTSGVIKLLDDPSHLVKEAAAIALSKNPDIRGLEPLIRHTRHKDLRLRGAILTSLWRITGQTFLKESEWKAWFKETGPYPETNLNPNATPPAPSSFLDIPLWTNSVVYLVDEETMSGESRDKLAEAKRLIRESISRLPTDTRINVIFFSTGMRSFSYRGLVRVDPAVKLKVAEWLDRLQPIQVSGSDFHGTLLRVLKTRPDDVILISDNAPNAGRYVYPPKVVNEITESNLYQKTRIHSVGFYTTLKQKIDKKAYPVGSTVDFLRELSMRNYGEFRYRWFPSKCSTAK